MVKKKFKTEIYYELRFDYYAYKDITYWHSNSGGPYVFHYDDLEETKKMADKIEEIIKKNKDKVCNSSRDLIDQVFGISELYRSVKVFKVTEEEIEW